MTAEDTAVRVVDHHGEIVETARYDDLKMLDTYAGGLATEEARLDAIATISAGYRAKGEGDKPGLPQRSTDGTIYIHYNPKSQRPPTGLTAALERRGNKRLTIAFPFDNPAAFVQQRFMGYTAAKLTVYGDENGLYVIENGNHVFLDPESERYQAALKSGTIKATTMVYFGLAEWDGDNARMIWPDGAGFYRLRFTSRHSLRNLRAALKTVADLTGGRLAGVPFDLALDYREVAGPDGAKRTIPCWTFTLNPPKPLSSVTWRRVIGGALEQGAQLRLPPPGAETLELALAEEPEPDLDVPTEAQVDIAAAGGLCDPHEYEALYFTMARGTRFATDEGRADFISWISQDRTTSLASFLGTATEAEASTMIGHLGFAVANERNAIPTAEERVAARRGVAGDPEEKAFYAALDAQAAATGTEEPRFFRRPNASASAPIEPAAPAPAPDAPAPSAAPGVGTDPPTNRALDAYATALSRAAQLGLDLAHYEINAQTVTAAELSALHDNLLVEIDAAEPEHRLAGM